MLRRNAENKGDQQAVVGQGMVKSGKSLKIIVSIQELRKLPSIVINTEIEYAV